jgi:tetratricopeptide (TPR) repeat protein
VSTGEGGATTDNTASGSPGAVVQAGTVHGGVHITAARERPVSVPRQLPFAVSAFVDREEHLRRLDALAADGGEGVPVAVLAGPPGVGKTALAVHWAHRSRERFPGGNLYVGMRGHAPGPRAEASQALGSLLRAVGVDPDRVPLDLDGRSALFRSELDGRRLLIVIDDVLDPAQVRPLLPASPGCMVVVTSRDTLTGLVVREGATRLSLGVLARDDSVALLRATVGARVDAEPGAAHRLAEHCAGLPLALRVAAERLTDRPHDALNDLVAELAVEESRLDTLSEEDELSDLRAVMSTSYEALDDDTARFFRRLGAHPGDDFSGAAAGALTGAPPLETRRSLDRLTRAHLVERTRPDRYRLHDLVRLYAVERFEAHESPDAVGAAVERVARWYTHAAARAQRSVHPNFPTVPGAAAEGELPGFPSDREALAWFERERLNLLAVLHAAVERGLDDIAWRLPASVYPLFELHRHWDEWRDTHVVGIRAAERAGDPFGRARNHLGMGDALWLSDDLDEAAAHYRAALGANAVAGDPWVEGFAERQLGEVAWRRGDRDHAVGHLERAIAVFRAAGERRGEAMGLLSKAGFSADLGRFDAALADARAAVAAFGEIGDVWSVAWGECTVGRALVGTGRAAEAVERYRSAVTVFDDRSDDDSRAVALAGLAEAHLGLGEHERAREALGAALEYLRDVGDPRVREVEERLASLRERG